VTCFASLSRVPPLAFDEKKGLDLSRFSDATMLTLLLLTRGVTKTRAHVYVTETYEREGHQNKGPRVRDGNIRERVCLLVCLHFLFPGPTTLFVEEAVLHFAPCTQGRRGG